MSALSPADTAEKGPVPAAPTFTEATKVWAKIGLLSFGGPAGQIALMHKDDLVQLEASLSLYDAFYRWARDAVSEEHNWPTPTGGRA